MTTKTLYKVMRKDLSSVYYPENTYKLGSEYVCKDFDTSDKECSRGFYAVDLEGLPYAWINDGSRVITEVQVSGRYKEFNQFKRRFEKQTITRVLEKDEVLSLIREKVVGVGYNLSEALYPINPLLIENKLETKHKLLLKEWDSVWDSVKNSVGDSVKNSVWDSVKNSVWDSVGDSVWGSVKNSVGGSVGNSVWDSVGAYYSSLFHNKEKWKYIEHAPFENPFQSCIDLWRDGFVPSFDGKVWRLHQGVKAQVVFEITKEDLQKLK